jgi:hypothetical protein
MREPENCSLKYCGFNNPKDFEEIQFETLGLKNLIKRAEERLSMLEQSSFLANLAINNEAKDLEQYFSAEGLEHDKGNSIKEKE